MVRPLVITFCVMLVGVLLCEWVLGTLQTDTTPWAYRLVTIIFAALLASGMTYIVIRKQDSLFQEVHEEDSKLRESEAVLQDSCVELENQVKEQTGEFTLVNNQLRVEIKKRKQLEVALHESEDKTRNILNSIEDGFFEVDLSGNFTSFNESLCRIIGYPREQMEGMSYRDYSKENADKVYATFNKVFKSGESVKEFDWEIYKKDGTKRYVEASISLIKNFGTEPRGFRGIVRDITERRETEDKIKEMLNAFGKIWTK
ncbi:MAG: PAS domain S-box protein [Deltaproteobacteria bacterium]|nr:PAS domain S-box protein [Deltaproteobacteria bacterium]